MSKSRYHSFLNPILRPDSLDTAGVRRAILDALTSNARFLKGVLLDVGCGDMPYKEILLKPAGCAEQYIGLDIPNSIYSKPDLAWDGSRMPLKSESVDCALATEVTSVCNFLCFTKILLAMAASIHCCKLN